MAFKTNRPETVRNYRYGCLQPDYGVEEIHEQLRLATDHWNRYVDLWHWERREYDRILSKDERYRSVTEKIQALNREIDELYGSLRKIHSRIGYAKLKKRDQTNLEAEEQELLKAVEEKKKERRALYQQKKALRPEVQTNFAKDLEDLESKRKERVNQVYHSDPGLYWGTKLEIQRRYDQARKDSFAGKGVPRRKTFDSTGVLTVRFQEKLDGAQGLPVHKLFERVKGVAKHELNYWKMHENVYIKPPIIDPKAGKKKNQRTYMRFCVRTIDRRPIWARIPIIYHRPLPEEGRVKEVKLVKERQGTRFKYSAVFSVAVPAASPAEPDLPAVGIDLNWRTIGGQLRVATIVGSDGYFEEVFLNQKVVDALERSKQIKSTWEKNFEMTKARVVRWLERNEVPEWLAEMTSHIEQWRSHGRLHKLSQELLVRLDQSCDKRLRGLFNILTRPYKGQHPWVWQDRHLYDWWINLDNKARAIREHQYKNLAARLVKKYRAIYMEDINLGFASRKAGPESVDRGTAQRYNRSLAGHSVLRSAIQNASARERVYLGFVDPANTSKQCSICGSISDLQGDIAWVCPNCGAHHDRDRNAATNILRKGLGLGPLATGAGKHDQAGA